MKDLQRELFEMVYQWGRVGVVVDEHAPSYQRTLNAIKIEEANKARTLVWGIGYDDDPTARMLRDKLWERIDFLNKLNTELTPTSAPLTEKKG